jgi:hypothetical protein
MVTMLIQDTRRYMHTRVNKEHMLAATGTSDSQKPCSHTSLARPVGSSALLDDVVQPNTSLPMAKVRHLKVVSLNQFTFGPNHKMMDVVFITRAGAVDLHLDIARLRGSLVMKRACPSSSAGEGGQRGNCLGRRDRISIRHWCSRMLA